MSSICDAVLSIGFLFSRKIISPECLSTSGFILNPDPGGVPTAPDVAPLTFEPDTKLPYPVLEFWA